MIGLKLGVEDTKTHLSKLVCSTSRVIFQNFSENCPHTIWFYFLKKAFSVLQTETNGMIYNVIKTFCSKKKNNVLIKNIHFMLYMHLAHLLRRWDRCLLIWISDHIARLLMAQ